VATSPPGRSRGSSPPNCARPSGHFEHDPPGPPSVRRQVCCTAAAMTPGGVPRHPVWHTGMAIHPAGSGVCAVDRWRPGSARRRRCSGRGDVRADLVLYRWHRPLLKMARSETPGRRGTGRCTQRGGPRLVAWCAAHGDERARLWARWREIDKNLDAYAARRDPETAVVVLEPRPTNGGSNVASPSADPPRAREV
jgi:hypothetical protein